MQKEDIAETAVHFVLKWGFEVNQVSNNSRMLEPEDLGGIASLKQGLLQGHLSVTNQRSMASCRVLNCGYFGTKRKAIGQVEEELWFFLNHF